MDVSARFAGAVVSFVVVSVILLQTSVTLGLVVLIGVPLLMLGVAPILGPLQRRSRAPAAPDGPPVQHRQRHRRRPAGAARHRRRAGLPRPLPPRVPDHPRAPASRSPGCSRCSTRSRCFLPGLFVVVVVWIGARYAVAGHDHPRRAGRVLRLLGLPDDPAADRDRVRQQGDPRPGRGRPDLHGARARARGHRAREPRRRPRPPAPTWSTPAPASVVRAGLLTAIVSEQPDDSAELADRLGMTARPVDDEVRLGGVPLDLARPGRGAPTASWSPTPARCSSPAGSATGSTSPATATSSARSTRASADDILEALADGLDTRRRRARPQLLRRPAPAAGAGAGARGRPGDPGAGRADLGGRRPHRGPDRRAAAAATAPAAPRSSPRPAR